jgi:hypothetical protein
MGSRGAWRRSVCRTGRLCRSDLARPFGNPHHQGLQFAARVPAIDRGRQLAPAAADDPGIGRADLWLQHAEQVDRAAGLVGMAFVKPVAIGLVGKSDAAVLVWDDVVRRVERLPLEIIYAQALQSAIPTTIRRRLALLPCRLLRGSRLDKLTTIKALALATMYFAGRSIPLPAAAA